MVESSSHVLGLKWDHVNDTLVVSRGTKCDPSRPVTRRLVLSLVSKVYDPIGIDAPVNVTARLLLKDLWRLHGQSWNDVLLREMIQRFSSWSSELPKLGLMTISLSYLSGSLERLEIHVVVDSSPEMFSAVAFFQALANSSNSGKGTKLAFVIRKARVSPTKALTIPKLELQAALLASRLREEKFKALIVQIQRIFMWTYSTTVYQCLNSAFFHELFL